MIFVDVFDLDTEEEWKYCPSTDWLRSPPKVLWNLWKSPRLQSNIKQSEF